MRPAQFIFRLYESARLKTRGKPRPEDLLRKINPWRAILVPDFLNSFCTFERSREPTPKNIEEKAKGARENRKRESLLLLEDRVK